MKDRSKISAHQICEALHNATFSQALEAGLTHSIWLDGPGTDKCGRDLALVSHLAAPGEAADSKMKDTCGRHSAGLSPSANLQPSLENRLQANLGVNGSPEYVLTWKHWDMQSGPPICALRASGRRTSGKDYSGWPTPTVGNAMGSQMAKGASLTGRRPNGTKATVSLNMVAQAVAGWPTPCQQDGPHGGPRQGTDRLPGAVSTVTGWATPAARDYKGESASDQFQEERRRQTRGKPLSWQAVQRAKSDGYRLNPLFSLWLMGYPLAEWACSVVPEMQSCLK